MRIIRRFNFRKQPDYPALSCAMLLALLVLACVVLANPADASESVEDSEEDGSDDSYETEIEITVERESFDFNNDPNDEKASVNRAEIDIDQSFSFHNHGIGLAGITASAEREDPRTGRSLEQDYLALNELWAGWNTGQSFAWIGRRAIEDSINWWWDDELLGAGFVYTHEKVTGKLVLAHSVEDWSTLDEADDPENNSIIRLLSSLEIPLDNDALFTTFLTHQTDQSSRYRTGQTTTDAQLDESDSDLTWVGLRYQKTISSASSGGLTFLIDAAYVTGSSETVVLAEDDDEDMDEEDNSEQVPDTAQEILPEPVEIAGITKHSISGWALNTWIDWAPPVNIGTTLRVGYAYGSGTGRNNAQNTRTFQQSGIHSNETDTAYYGAILDPDLSNLSVASLLITQPTGESGHFYLQYNRYQRASIHDDTLEVEIELEFQKASRDIGQALAFGYRHEFGDSLLAKALISRFEPGSAFGSLQPDPVDYYEISLNYEF